MNTLDNKKTLNKDIDKVYRQGNIQKAIELCQYEISKDPANPLNADLHVKLGDLYLEWHLDIYQAKQYIDEAITEYQRALESYVNSATLYYKIGRAFFYKNEIDKAINYFNLAAEKSPKMSDAYYMLAECYTKKHDLQPAFDYVQKAISTSNFLSSRAHFLYFILLRLSAKRSLKKSFICIRELFLAAATLLFDGKAVTSILKLISYTQFLPVLSIGAFYMQKGNVGKAIELYQNALEQAPGFTLLYCVMGEIYRSLGRYSDAICEYKMAIWLDTLNVSAYRALCATYEEQGDYENAIDVYKKLIKIQPYVAEYYSNLGSLLYVKDDMKEAVACYQNAVTLNPNAQWTSIVAQTLGYVYQTSEKNIDAAIASYQTAYLLCPNDIDIYINLGSAFYDKSEYENALMVYRKALELDPGNAKIHCNLGYLYWGCGVIEEAIKSYEMAVKYDTSYDIAYNNLGVIYLDDLGRVKRATELFSAAIKCNPNYALAYYNLARSISISGDNVEAAKLYQIAYDLNKISNELDPQEILEKIQQLFE